MARALPLYTVIGQAPTLDPEFKYMWTMMLRSGRYKQGRGYLHNITEGTYCCLGVACELDGTAERSGTEIGFFNSFEVETYDGSGRVLPSFMIYKYGFVGEPGVLPVDILYRDGTYNCPSLTQLNDNGFTFDQIADMIDFFL